MSDNQRQLDELLRRLAGSPVPNQDEHDRAASELRKLFDREGLARPRRRPVLIWVAAVLVVALGIFVILRPGSVSPAAATMEEIASTAETVDPLGATDDSFVYIRSESTVLAEIPREGLGDVPYSRDQLIYHFNTTRETWIGNDETVQIAVTVLEPSFFMVEDEAVYYVADLQIQDQVGETITTTVTLPDDRNWPTDPDELDAAIRKDMITDRNLLETVEYLDVALDILGESHASPELRAATLRLIGDLPGLEFIGTDADGVSTFQVEYDDRGVAKRLTFNVDTSGYLRFEELLSIDGNPTLRIPPDSAEFTFVYAEPISTTDLSTPGS
jgi:hypothetical protein